ncbi:glycoside hydrolase family 95 protein [Plebeiibacterium sediminum]|uniref:Glycoside hydrolase N-terminal domain-containing protein n=1 Tax=Plebeiibacterium sediminum TaxID=2992112 RepID=A0AAE3SF92_9BACT|nr:glycoside hydrolase N-terminal domain-containing protein [Plebeiobacterium sediminum]MCW3785943.1 glycoside hydrolase N-terminal domain-containing protein [Plebeiobacterium sediminum]
MKTNFIRLNILFAAIIVVLVSSCNNKKEEIIELWYNKPAKTWEEALPIGNGRLGAMIYGDPQIEQIQFNEETLWNGSPRKYQRDNAYKSLDKIRQLLFDGKQDIAEKLAAKTFMGRLAYEDEFPVLKAQWVDSINHLDIVKKGVLSSFDDSTWPEMFIDYKSVWERKGLPDMNGAVLFRKTIDIPAQWKGKSLKIHLGKIKDHDFTYINGHLIGTKDESNTNRIYTIPAKFVKTGKNVIAVLINNYVSTGGFNAVRTGPKKMNITPVNFKADPLFIEGNWKYKVIDRKPPYYPEYQAKYQPFGVVRIEFEGHDSITNFRRSLEINNALSKTSYTCNGVQYQREYLASHPDNLIAVKLSSNKKNQLNFKACLETLHAIYNIEKIDDQTLALSIKVEDGEMKGTAYLNISSNDGIVNIKDNQIVVSNASEAVIKLIASTNYKAYNDISGNAKEICDAQLPIIESLQYDEIRTSHLNDYKPIFNRFSIDLGDHEKRQTPTDERIFNIKNQEDKDLAALYVQYARYLMLSSGREGTNPPNLQGIWNEEIYPAWGSKYTTNINCEMNFWPVEPLNISECHNTLFKLIDEVAIEGAKTAKAYYSAKGWVHHHNTDQWRGTAPINNSNHGIWVTGGAWLAHHLWEHYMYTQDKEFLKTKAYPLLKGSAEFFADFLVKDPKTGYLISTPSNSPEHGGLVAGPTMDHQIIRSLFKIVIESSDILDTDHEFAAMLKDKLTQMAPDQIGKHGQLQEWMEDKDDTTDTHRHISHLWGVHPGNEITWDNNPELMKAAKQSLIYRGDDGTGWSLAWKINFWARFLDGNHANTMIKMLLGSALDPERNGGGGSYPNLFDAHPPFQIDGNFGGAAGIVEMIMQSHQGYIQLLPALPDSWQSGSIKGLKARGGFEIDMEWNEGKLYSLSVLSTAGNKLKIKYGKQMIEQETRAGETYQINNLIN